MPWGVYQEYLSARAQGTFRAGPRKWKGVENRLHRKLYQSFGLANQDTDSFLYNKHYPIRGGKDYLKLGPSGGIFNLEFNPDGSILGAACEQKSIILFDPLTRRPIKFIEKAHNDCVNCIRFFDSRLFATCSDDTTVALWDARYLKHRLRTLRGHSNWVKNIEFSHKDNCLVTSGFDGAIYTWDINNYSERTDGSPEFRKVFYTNGLMRMKLTPTWDKMVVSTMNGYIMVVHDLCLDTMSQDLQSFKPNMYRLMQISGKPLPVAVQYTPLFHAKRNRVEFISDFPEDDEAEIISSLQLHPQGWVAVSRNVSSDDKSEWCCVHDIHSYSSHEELDEQIDPELKVFKSVEERHRRRRPSNNRSIPPLEGTPAQRNAGLGMARLAEFIGGVHFSTDPISPNLPELNTENRRRNEDRSRQEGQNSNRSTEFRIRTIVNGVEQRNNANEDHEDASSAPTVDPESNEVESRSNDESNASRLVDIIQLLGTVAGSGSGALRIRRRDPSINEPRPNPSPMNEREDPRVPNPQNPIASTSSSNSLDRNNARIQQDEVRNDNTEGQPNTRRRSHLGQQGFIIFPPDPRNMSRGPSILYFGGSGQNERSLDRDETPSSQNDGDNVATTSSAQSSNHSSTVNNPPAYISSNRRNFPPDARLHHNSHKLTHYLQESNQGRGFIKEVSFSPDGRIIASPFAYGIRLLAFNSDCSDLSSHSPTSWGPSNATQLHEMLHITGCHEDVVLSSAFSPHDLTLVTGCHSGRVIWNQPVL